MIRQRKARAWGCGVSLTLFLISIGLLAREVVLRAAITPPRQKSHALPRTKPAGVAHWDEAAAALLEQNERTLQNARTLVAQVEYVHKEDTQVTARRTKQIIYARPNRLRDEELDQGKKRPPRLANRKVSDGWLSWSLLGDTYYGGFSFPDGRGQNEEPFVGFFPTDAGGWDPISFADEVRGGVLATRLELLTLEPTPQGRVVRFRYKPSVGAHSWGAGGVNLSSSTTTITFPQSSALPAQVEEQWVDWRGSWTRLNNVPVLLWNLQLHSTSYHVQSVTLDGPVPTGAFVMTFPRGVKPSDDTARFEKLFLGFTTLRSWTLGE
ncbi:hypothetical protein [Armatimonas rosea]|uniref:Uncharacterized protein n=1 Tax=Armatimonas rosea TaxID=685828 RepID=A0A7W9SRK8_ARMRO|nr:hypothetical protein [Armatimonas rosea]MBB6050904.1 hypothetical protein [Armatimonas rosea]